MLYITEAACQKLENKQEVKIEDLEQLAAFLELFIYSIHHQKEANLLSERMPELQPHLDEHKQEKVLFDNFMSEIKGYKGNANDESLINSARDYVSFANNHINKEEEEVYPAVNKTLSDEDTNLLNDFEQLENENISEEQAEEYQKLLSYLAENYLGEHIHSHDCEHGECDCGDEEECDCGDEGDCGCGHHHDH